MCSLALNFIELGPMKSLQGFLFLFFVQINLVDLAFKVNLVIINFSVQVFNLSFVLLPIFLQLLLSLLKFFTNIFVVNLQLLMLSGQVIKVTSSMFQLALKLRHFSLKLFNSCLQKFLFRLSIFGLLLFGQGKSLHFLAERFLNILHSLLMLDLIFIQHLLVHIDLLCETLLNPISLLLDLGQAILKNTDRSFRLTNLGRLLFNPLKLGGFLVEDIVDEFARGEGKGGIGSFSEFLRRQIFKFGRRSFFAHPAVQEVFHFQNNIYYDLQRVNKIYFKSTS